MARRKLTEEEKQENKKLKELRRIWDALKGYQLKQMWIRTLPIDDQTLVYRNFDFDEPSKQTTKKMEYYNNLLADKVMWHLQLYSIMNRIITMSNEEMAVRLKCEPDELQFYLDSLEVQEKIAVWEQDGKRHIMLNEI